MFVPLVRFRVGKKNLYKLFLFKILVLLIVAHSCDLIRPDQGLSLSLASGEGQKTHCELG